MRHSLLGTALIMGCLGSAVSLAEEVPAEAAPATTSPVVAQDQAGDAYRIGPGDTLDIQVFGEEDLSMQFVVGASGSLDFPLVGQVEASGLTVSGLDERLTARLGEKFLRNPQVQIVVESYASQPVQVLGAVKKPGVFHLSGTTTVLDIIAKAGGVREEGVSEVRIQHKDSSQPTTVVKLDQLMGEKSESVQLQAGDVVYVSEGLVVYISGEVNKPGAVSYTEGLTVTQALTRSGGTKRTAKLRDVYILRGEEKIAINVKKILAGRAADVALKPNDQLILKESVF